MARIIDYTMATLDRVERNSRLAREGIGEETGRIKAQTGNR